jgi:hypothetical protein
LGYARISTAQGQDVTSQKAALEELGAIVVFTETGNGSKWMGGINSKPPSGSSNLKMNSSPYIQTESQGTQPTSSRWRSVSSRREPAPHP